MGCPGTEMGYPATRIPKTPPTGMCLRACYAMSGTVITYGAMRCPHMVVLVYARAVRCAVLRSRRVLPACAVGGTMPAVLTYRMVLPARSKTALRSAHEGVIGVASYPMVLRNARTVMPGTDLGQRYCRLLSTEFLSYMSIRGTAIWYLPTRLLCDVRY
eukprot:54316-Rhodomonas_salina.2